jgi:MoxR-like ATPase
MQFTPDVLPTDVTGFTMLRQDTQKMEYQPGAVMCNLLLADEINRASTRSQSALLEAMEEGAVTVDGVTHELPSPFIVIATQNPFGASGTQPLPESQTDRFMTRLSIGYPDKQMEIKMMLIRHGDRLAGEPERVANAEELIKMREEVTKVFLSEEIYAYISTLTRATRKDAWIYQGASPRCTVQLMAMAQASAYLGGRDYVIPEDVKEVYIDCTAHRLVLTPQAKRETTAADILARILEETEAPSLKA